MINPSSILIFQVRVAIHLFSDMITARLNFFLFKI